MLALTLVTDEIISLPEQFMKQVYSHVGEIHDDTAIHPAEIEGSTLRDADPASPTVSLPRPTWLANWPMPTAIADTGMIINPGRVAE